MLAIAAGGLIVGGCGGSSSSSKPLASSSVAQAQPTTSVQAITTRRHRVAGGKRAGGKRASSRIVAGKTVAGKTVAGKTVSGERAQAGGKQHLKVIDVVSKPHVQRGRGGEDEPVPPVIKGPNPCLLVSQGEAQAILGGPVAETEAPLGPTCIFKVGQHTRVITLAVETLNISTAVREMKKLQRATIAGQQAYCGELGQSQLYLSLSGGKALTVTAPCGVAKALAVKAVAHLNA